MLCGTEQHASEVCTSGSFLSVTLHHRLIQHMRSVFWRGCVIATTSQDTVPPSLYFKGNLTDPDPMDTANTEGNCTLRGWSKCFRSVFIFYCSQLHKTVLLLLLPYRYEKKRHGKLNTSMKVTRPISNTKMLAKWPWLERGLRTIHYYDIHNVLLCFCKNNLHLSVLKLESYSNIFMCKGIWLSCLIILYQPASYLASPCDRR